MRAGRVHAHEPQPVAILGMHARVRHHRRGDVVTEPVVVAGRDRERAGDAERIERGLEASQLGLLAAMGDVARHDHVVDPGGSGGVHEGCAGALAAGVAAEVEIGQVKERAGSSHDPRVPSRSR